MPDYLHKHRQFKDLLNIVAEEKSILAGLVEKDFWIMHVLYGLRKQGFNFELKGGTSLSKGHKIIYRFSEDIDIHITPPESMGINENPKNCKESTVKARKNFYDWLANEIKIDGIVAVKRDIEFDDIQCYRSGGVRLFYETHFDQVDGVKEGILLEAGFDQVHPNEKLTIDSWAYLHSQAQNVAVTDNRATDIVCYHPGYTFVEKLQTVVSKYRQEKSGTKQGVNFMRQYYDISCLLDHPVVLEFIGTEDYHKHKELRFSTQDREVEVSKHEAFLLDDKKMRDEFSKRYASTKTLYYKGQPSFDEVVDKIIKHLPKL